VPATASGSTRYLFLLPKFKEGGVYQEDLLVPDDVTLTLKGVSQPASIKLLGASSRDAVLKYDYSDNAIKIQVPATMRSTLVDVVEVKLR
jgi:alpha-L-fucosidase